VTGTHEFELDAGETPRFVVPFARLFREERATLAGHTIALEHGEVSASVRAVAQVARARFERRHLRGRSEGLDEKRCRHQDLRAAEIGEHLRAGKRAQRLGLSWQERIGFVLCDDLALLRLKTLDQHAGEADTVDDDPLAELDARFALTTGDLGALLERLGEVIDWR